MKSPPRYCWPGVYTNRTFRSSLFNPRVMMVRAAAYLILQGPVTSQERWEENAGYSPSTLATVIAASCLRRAAVPEIIIWRERRISF